MQEVNFEGFSCGVVQIDLMSIQAVSGSQNSGSGRRAIG